MYLVSEKVLNVFAAIFLANQLHCRALLFASLRTNMFAQWKTVFFEFKCSYLTARSHDAGKKTCRHKIIALCNCSKDTSNYMSLLMNRYD